MKASFMLTTQRQNCNIRNGRVLGLQDPKKHVCKKANWGRCSFVFFDQEGIVHREFAPPGITVNADFYCDVLRRLCENVRRKRPQKWRNQNLINHHDNAPAHRSFKVSQFLVKNNMKVIPHPPYSPDLAPCDFSFSPSRSFGWRVEHSTPLKRFKRNHSGYLTQFQKGTCRDASKHGRNAGTSVFVQKGSTLKVMEEFNIQGKQTSFDKYCPGTFGYTLVWSQARVIHAVASGLAGEEAWWLWVTSFDSSKLALLHNSRR